MREMLVAVVVWVALQSAGVPAPVEVSRISGVDAESGAAFVLISTGGRLVGADGLAGAAHPRLTAQCTSTREGKLRFELLADFGGVEALTYVAPWRPQPNELFPPPVEKAKMTMEFLGYTKVKPVKREWDAVPGLAGEWKYATPGSASSNLEPVMFYLQFLRALPGFRLTLAGKDVAEFETTKWQAAVKAEPLCGASAL